MRVETIGVGRPRVVAGKGDEVLTSIFKTPVPGTVTAMRHNLEGDWQSDLKVTAAHERLEVALLYAVWQHSMSTISLDA
jgi:MOSC domain-containing protein YiiM